MGCRFEEGEVGGRTQIFAVSGGEKIELGASIVHEENKYFREAADSLQITRLTPESSTPSIFDGKDFVFNFSYWTLVNLIRMVNRYGWSYFTFSAAPASSLERYKSIYALQEEGRAFATPEEMLKAMGLYDLTQRTFREEVQVCLILLTPCNACHFGVRRAQHRIPAMCLNVSICVIQL